MKRFKTAFGTLQLTKGDLLSIVITALATILFATFVGQPAVVIGESMLPTLKSSEIVFLKKICCEYEYNDIVVVKTPGEKIIKRVIGLPGDTVQIIDGRVYVNESPIKDKIDVTIEDAGIAAEPITLLNDEYFVLGDNRNNSRDSRSETVGKVAKDNIMGEVVIGLLPLKKIT